MAPFLLQYARRKKKNPRSVCCGDFYTNYFQGKLIRPIT